MVIVGYSRSIVNRMSTDLNSIKWQLDAVLIFLMRRFFRIANDFA